MHLDDDQQQLIPPPEVIIPQMAIHRRAFTAINSFAKERDVEGMKFLGILANALHNVPEELLAYQLQHARDTPLGDSWSNDLFIAQITEARLPSRLVELGKAMFSSKNGLPELGLLPGMRNLRLAPYANLQHYLKSFADVWLGLRMALGSRGDNVSSFKNHEWDWYHLVGELMRELPILLVRWSDSREKRFWENAEQSLTTCSPLLKRRWEKYLTDVKMSGMSTRNEPSPPRPQSSSPLRFCPYQWVTERIALGSEISRDDLPQLARDGVTHVLDCRAREGSKTLYRGTSITYRQHGVVDDGQSKPDEWFWNGIDFVTRALEHRTHRVLVHCKMGMSRSPSMVYAILLTQGKTNEEAQEMITKARIVAKVTYEKDARRAVGRWLRGLHLKNKP